MSGAYPDHPGKKVRSRKLLPGLREALAGIAFGPLRRMAMKGSAEKDDAC
jgi:hypothetical protein